MDFITKAISQLNDLFRSMTPGGRITAGLLLIVAVVSVGYLFQSQVTGGDEYLFGGVSIPTPTLQKMEEAFGKAGLNGFTIDGSRVKVPRSQRASYLAALADSKALPPNFGDKMKEGTEGGMFEDPKQRERRKQQAIMDELSLVISCMKGIERASVLIDSQAQPGLGQPPLKTASVAAQGIGGVPLDDDQVDKIRHYVSAAIAGMKPENVTIADANGRVHPGAEVADHGGQDGDPYARAVRKAEQTLNGKIREALSYIPNLTVTSTITLDREKGSRSVEVKNDPKPVPVRTVEASRSSNRESSSPGGAPGLQAQGGGVNQPASLASSGKGGNETNEETKNEQVNVVSTVSTETEKYGLAFKSATCSIGIPASYYEMVWQKRNPAKEGEEAKKPDQAALDKLREEIRQDVRGHVATLLPASEGKDPTTMVTVTTFQDVKSAAIPAPAVTEKALIWLGQNWPMLAMIGLVLFSLGMLRSVMHGAPAAPAEPATVSARVPATPPGAEEKAESAEATAARRLRRMTGGGPSLRDELSEFVKEDPDSAANVLRAWIGQVT